MKLRIQLAGVHSLPVVQWQVEASADTLSSPAPGAKKSKKKNTHLNFGSQLDQGMCGFCIVLHGQC